MNSEETNVFSRRTAQRDATLKELFLIVVVFSIPIIIDRIILLCKYFGEWYIKNKDTSEINTFKNEPLNFLVQRDDTLFFIVGNY